MLERMAPNFDYIVPARTHGQLAVPDDIQTEVRSICQRTQTLVGPTGQPNFVKFGGAIGNFDEAKEAIRLVYCRNFMEIVLSFGPFRNEFEREIDSFQNVAIHQTRRTLNLLGTICTFLIKIDLICGCISRGYFVLVSDGNRIGSSVMTQK